MFLSKKNFFPNKRSAYIFLAFLFLLLGPSVALPFGGSSCSLGTVSTSILLRGETSSDNLSSIRANDPRNVFQNLSSKTFRPRKNSSDLFRACQRVYTGFPHFEKLQDKLMFANAVVEGKPWQRYWNLLMVAAGIDPRVIPAQELSYNVGPCKVNNHPYRSNHPEQDLRNKFNQLIFRGLEKKFYSLPNTPVFRGLEKKFYSLPNTPAVTVSQHLKKEMNTDLRRISPDAYRLKKTYITVYQKLAAELLIRQRRCAAMAILTSESSTASYHGDKNPITSTDGKFRCKSDGKITQDFDSCREIASKYDGMLLAQLGLKTGQQLQTKIQQAKAISNIKTKTRTVGASGTAQGVLGSQEQALKELHDQKKMSMQQAGEQAALHTAQVAVLSELYANNLPDRELAVNYCKRILPTNHSFGVQQFRNFLIYLKKQANIFFNPNNKQIQNFFIKLESEAQKKIRLAKGISAPKIKGAGTVGGQIDAGPRKIAQKKTALKSGIKKKTLSPQVIEGIRKTITKFKNSLRTLSSLDKGGNAKAKIPINSASPTCDGKLFNFVDSNLADPNPGWGPTLPYTPEQILIALGHENVNDISPDKIKTQAHVDNYNTRIRCYQNVLKDYGKALRPFGGVPAGIGSTPHFMPSKDDHSIQIKGQGGDDQIDITHGKKTLDFRIGGDSAPPSPGFTDDPNSLTDPAPLRYEGIESLDINDDGDDGLDDLPELPDTRPDNTNNDDQFIDVQL